MTGKYPLWCTLSGSCSWELSDPVVQIQTPILEKTTPKNLNQNPCSHICLLLDGIGLNDEASKQLKL